MFILLEGPLHLSLVPLDVHFCPPQISLFLTVQPHVVLVGRGGERMGRKWEGGGENGRRGEGGGGEGRGEEERGKDGRGEDGRGEDGSGQEEETAHYAMSLHMYACMYVGT